MKKFLSFILVLSMLCQGVIYARETDTKIGVNTGLLEALGIISQNDEVGEYITRGDAAVYVAKMLGLKLTSTNEEVTSGFADMTGQNIICDAVCKLSSLGVVHGNGTENFLPEDNITKADAISLFLGSLGYKKEILASSGYLGKGVTLAKDLGFYVTDGRGDSEDISAATFFEMMIKALETDMIVLGGSIDGQLSYKISDEDNILSEYHDIEKYKGIVTANSYFSINGGSTTSKKSIEIESVVYFDDYGASPEMAGQYVEYYIRDDDTLVYLEPHRKNETLTIDRTDILSYNDGKYYYNKDGRSKYVDFDYTSKPVIYNYTLLMEYGSEFMLPSCGSLTFVDNNGDDDYDVLYIMSYKNFYVTGTQQEEETLYVYDANLSVKKPLIINTGDDGTLLCNTDMEAVETKTVKSGHVVSAFGHETDSGYEAVVAIVSGESLQGMVDNINPDENVTNLEEAVVDGETFELYGNLTVSQLEVKKAYTFALDYKGRIAAFAIDSENSIMALGYLLYVKYIDEEDAVQMKVLTEFGKVHKYLCSEKVKIHDTGRFKADELLAWFGGEGEQSRMMGYRVNEDGQIYSVSFPKAWSIASQDAEIFTAFSGSSEYYVGGARSFNNRYVVSDKAKVFTIADGGADDDHTVGTPAESLSHAQTYNVDGYVLSQDATSLDVVVVHIDAGESSGIDDETAGATASVVHSVKSGLNEDDEVITNITIIGRNGKQTYVLKDGCKIRMKDGNSMKGELSEGDVISYSINYKEEIDLIEVLYDVSENLYAGLRSFGTDFGGKTRPVIGKAYNVSQNVIQLVDVAASISKSLTMAEMETYPIGSTTIVVYDSEETKGNRVRTGKVSDFMTYRMSGGNCSTVLVDSYQCNPKIFIIFK
ncbi:MAG: S-layer homology domain-containing protein [Clostridia bacterium]|nr:S-layer homology domain-containing protein [Clostridia bacterium]